MTVTEVVIIGVVTTLGSMVHGSTGVGLGLVAGPALLAVDPRFLPGPLMLSTIIVSIRHLLAERDNIDGDVFRRLLLGLPFGAAGAVVVLVSIDDRTMALGIGALVAVMAIALLAGFRLPRTPGCEFFGGAGAAFGAIAASLPGPPLVMSLHDLPGPAMRPTVASVASLLSLTTVVALAPIGRFGFTEAGLTLLLAPFVLVGLVIARVIRPWLDRYLFRPAILLIALAGGVALIVRNL